ncbi:jg24096 [Pararge aegeria aegeria]|uniref:Jg24096 protein n=1 Tax=Pararge aegeria aegeria TaxID=348720 RepID=A0A8S4QG61_9NEOP|nr:jg24096 [Pararge aegeria aegeria]
MGTANTTAGTSSWLRPSYRPYGGDSETASVSGDSRSSHRHVPHDASVIVQEPPIVPQQNIGAQYLEPVPYVGAVGMASVLPLPLQPVPVIVAPGQAQLQVGALYDDVPS